MRLLHPKSHIECLFSNAKKCAGARDGEKRGYAAAFILAKKSTSQGGFCLGDRRFNAVTNGVSPLPSIDDAMGCLYSALYSSLSISGQDISQFWYMLLTKHEIFRATRRPI